MRKLCAVWTCCIVSVPFLLQYHEEGDALLDALLQQMTFPLVMVLDGLDHLVGTNLDWVRWIPISLPSNVRLILSVTTDGQVHKALKVRTL